MNIALCFCVRNCERYLYSIFKNIELINELNINIYSIFIYDNCSDNSQYILEQYQKTYPNNVIVRSIENKSELRTVRIAKARNTCLDILYNELNDIKFHIMIDSDDVCSKKWNIDIINKYLNNFDNDNWDCISFHSNNYYDIWALLFDDFKHHCLGFGDKSNTVTFNIMKNVIVDKLNKCSTNSIDVLSAFNGFCIYKTNRFKGFYYDGLYSHTKSLITESERNNTQKMLKEKYNLDVIIHDKSIFNTDECCEHIFYHLSAHNNNRKIKISTYKIM